jgi:Brp/Blh family beta-carotene 15,15'-monooxygenase
MATARWADRCAILFLGLGLLQTFVGLDFGWFRFLPLALGMILFGLPHGAVDHLVALGLAGRSLSHLPLTIVIGLYLLVVVAVFASWVFFPFAAAVGFLIMTVYHWGKSDLAFERFCLEPAAAIRNRTGDGIHLILRGLIPIGMPFCAFPTEATEFVEACVRLFAPNQEVNLKSWQYLTFALLFSCFVWDGWVHLRQHEAKVARRVLVENMVLVAFFGLVPPLIAIGWYFAGWHGFRHILRLSHYEPPGVGSPAQAEHRVLRVLWQALPFTLAAILMLAGLAAGMMDRVLGTFGGVALYLVLVSALTLPHLLVVEWMDHRQKRTPAYC